MGGLTAVLAAAVGISSSAAGAAAAAREESFQHLLRTYAQRAPRETIAGVEALLAEGDFAGHDRAEFWMGTVLSSLGDGEGAERWFTRLQHDHEGSPWVERSWLSRGDAAVQQRRYALALAWYGQALSARDEEVRQIAGASIRSTQVFRVRQLWAWAAGGAVVGAIALLGISLLRHRPIAVWPLPFEARVILPVLCVLALLSLGRDPASRAAVLELCAGSALLVVLSGLRLRSTALRATARAAHAVGTIVALGALAYVVVYRAGLTGMLLETFRAGPG